MRCKICGSRLKLWYKKLFDDRHGYPGYFDVLKCTICGFAQTKPQIKENSIKKLYKDYYPRKNLDLKNIKSQDFKENHRFKFWRKGLLINCHYLVKPKSDVLDVGSGVGYSLLWLKNQGCNAYGIDPDANALRLAKKFKLNFHWGLIADNPFGNKKFDYITGSQVIEHTKDPIKFLVLCKQRLKPNGKIILSFPNTNSLSRILFAKSWLHWHLPYHLNHFNKKSIFLLASCVGFKIESIKTITPNMWTNLQIRRLLLKPEMGKRDVFWDGGKEGKKLASHPVKKVFIFLEEYNFANRLVDVLSLGESFVVTLTY